MVHGQWRSRRMLAAIAATTALVVGACSSGSTAAPSSGAAAASAGAASSAPAASAGTASGKPLFVAINKSADQQYFITLQQAFKAEIEKLGGQAKLYNAKLDANLAINEVNDAISSGAKGIAITVPDQRIGPSIATTAKNAGVALVITDDVVKDAAGNQLPFDGFSGTDMGNKVGTEAGQLLDQAGWLKDSSKKVGVLSVEVQTLSVCNDRTNAEKAQIEAAGVPAANVYPVPYDGTTPAAQSAAGPIITAHPDVTNWIVFGCNDEGVLGVLNALSTAGAQPANIIAVGLGAYLACVPWHANQASGFKAALYISGADVGTAAADELWNHVEKGQPLPLNTFAKTTIVTPQDYSTVMRPGDAPACFK